LVHDFLNTRGNGQHTPDLLGDGAHASAWGVAAVAAWRASTAWHGAESLPPALTDRDAAKLRDLRHALDAVLAGVPTNLPSGLGGTTELKLGDPAGICWVPTGKGWRWFYGAILGEVLLSHNTGAWQRIKQCRNSACPATFYDSSWNNATIWHNPGTCGPRSGPILAHS
jgi:hypothetical protein